jgi:hypothetical protein
VDIVVVDEAADVVDVDEAADVVDIVKTSCAFETTS